MAKPDELPDCVYLIKADTEWPISAVAVTGPDEQQASAVVREVERRRESSNVGRDGRVRVWRVPVTEAVEVEVVPEQTIPATLHVTDDDPPSGRRG